MTPTMTTTFIMRHVSLKHYESLLSQFFFPPLEIIVMYIFWFDHYFFRFRCWGCW